MTMNRTFDVYVAGSSKELARAERAIAALRRLPNVGVTHDWTVQVRACGPDSVCPAEVLQHAARADYDGVTRAAALWVLRPTTPSTGAWAELGIAIGAKMTRIVISGEGIPCVFEHLPGLIRLRTDEEAFSLFEEISMKLTTSYEAESK